MQIGDRVTTKRCGPPCVGRVVGIANMAFLQSYSHLQIDPNWIKHYPDCWKGNVVYLISDTPVKPFSFQEYKNTYEERLAQLPGESLDTAINTLKISYDLLSCSNLVIVPEDDVELL